MPFVVVTSNTTFWYLPSSACRPASTESNSAMLLATRLRALLVSVSAAGAAACSVSLLIWFSGSRCGFDAAPKGIRERGDERAALVFGGDLDLRDALLDGRAKRHAAANRQVAVAFPDDVGEPCPQLRQRRVRPRQDGSAGGDAHVMRQPWLAGWIRRLALRGARCVP